MASIKRVPVVPSVTAEMLCQRCITIPKEPTRTMAQAANAIPAIIVNRRTLIRRARLMVSLPLSVLDDGQLGLHDLRSAFTPPAHRVVNHPAVANNAISCRYVQ